VPVSLNRKAKPSLFSLKRYIDRGVKLVNAALNQHLPKASAKPRTLHESMRYSMFAGGKRLRPILCMAAAEACGGRASDSLILGSAVECIHTYSLIHDDLPGMDDDDLRRGKPTNHVVYGEGIAVLAGDALLTLAFDLANQARSTKRYRQNDYVGELAKTAGHAELIAGQVEQLGKTAGKDAAVQKATYPSIVGLAKSRKIAADLTTKAYDALKPLKGKAVALEALADYLLKRDH